MGRKRKYNTDEERRSAERIWKQNYYRKNAERIKRERMQKYYNEDTIKENIITVRSN